MFHHYRRLVELRHREPVVVHGDFTMLHPDHAQVYAYARRLDGAELVVTANLSSTAAEVDGETFGPWESRVLLDGDPVL